MGGKFFLFKSEREADKWLWQVRVLFGVRECGDWKAFSPVFLRRSCTHHHRQRSVRSFNRLFLRTLAIA
jgi:hypothetical protein